jgi:L-ascorbate metabolism protein UlaG (beta-lactamase superfamily)
MSIHEELMTAAIDAHTVSVWWLGQSGYALKNAYGEIIYVDPYLTEVISPLSYIMHTRLIPPVVAPDADVDVMAVLLTHDHLDHLDPNSVVMLADQPHLRFYGSNEVFNKLVEVLDIPETRVTEIATGEQFTVGHYRVSVVKAVHGGGAVGYVIGVDGLTLYFSGDTVLFYGMRDIGERFNIDVAFLCINGQAGNMDILGALHATRLTRPRIVVPNHYGMYADNTDTPEKFAYWLNQRFPDRECVILLPGKKHIFTRAAR